MKIHLLECDACGQQVRTLVATGWMPIEIDTSAKQTTPWHQTLHLCPTCQAAMACGSAQGAAERARMLLHTAFMRELRICTEEV